MPDIGLHTLSPAEGSTKERKRVGRGKGSGTGKTSGRGQKGQKSRSGSHNMRPGFEGGQMPLYMRMGKLRGPHMKKSMPMGPFRTSNEIVNLADLVERFESGARISPATMVVAGLLKNTREPVKVLGQGELRRELHVTAHAFSRSAREKIEAAGGTATVITAVPVEDLAPAAPPPADAAPVDAAPGDEPPADVASPDEA